jgi:hypothetical protein
MYVIGLLVYGGSIADGLALHNLSQDYNIIKHTALIIKLAKSIVYFHYYSY